jgi:malate dehydrogenase (oxaloacetate-decarboxylating)(NADP+)
MYMGLKQPRDRSPAYDALIEEFFDACQAVYGKNVLMQFEDFGNSNAFGLLDKFRKRACVFNDDIQGTASVALAGILSSLKLAKKSKLSDHTFLFFGAGEAGVGIADLLASAIANQDKTSLAEARKSIWLVDSKGLISSARTDKLAHHKEPYAHDLKVVPADDSLLASIQAVKPSAIIGRLLHRFNT